jgi:hypothetical protein
VLGPLPIIEQDAKVGHRPELVLARPADDFGSLASAGMRSTGLDDPAPDARVMSRRADSPAVREPCEDVERGAFAGLRGRSWELHYSNDLAW